MSPKKKKSDWYIYSISAFGILALFIIFTFIKDSSVQNLMFNVVIFMLGMVGITGKWKSLDDMVHQGVFYGSLMVGIVLVILLLNNVNMNIYGRRKDIQ